MATWTCPNCSALLSRTPREQWQCRACKIDFPVHTTVPFLYAQPNQALGDWRNRINACLADIETQSARAKRAASGAGPAGHERLTTLQQGCETQLAALQQICQPLAVGEALARETHIALGTDIGSHHGALSYERNILRDWCWGEEENQAALAQLTTLLANREAELNNILVLGGGAGRLAYDLHRSYGAAEVICLDFNPLLSQIGRRVSHGEALTFVEFPLAPHTAAQSAVAQTLSAPAPSDGNLHFVCADARQLPVPAGHFDLVVTPWLLDVVDSAADAMMRQINRALRTGGVWLYQGSVAFDSADPAYRYGAAELHDLAHAAGFEVRAHGDHAGPYLASPNSRGTRIESVHCFAATKLDELDESASPGGPPAWITDPTLPVPLSEAFQTQVLSVRVHAFVMSQLDGKRSINDVAAILEQQRLMPKAQAREAIRGFLKKMAAEAGADSAHQA